MDRKNGSHRDMLQRNFLGSKTLSKRPRRRSYIGENGRFFEFIFPLWKYIQKCILKTLILMKGSWSGNNLQVKGNNCCIDIFQYSVKTNKTSEFNNKFSS